VRTVASELGAAAPEIRRAVLQRLVPIGYPELDGLGTYERRLVRAKYGLPADRPIVFVSTAHTLRMHAAPDRGAAAIEAAFRGWRPISRRALRAIPFAIRRGTVVPYREYLAALRRFADANGACLVAKTRAKHEDPPYLGDYVDTVIGDESFYPFTTLELLSVSDLSFGFVSGTALEAVASGVYALTAYHVPMERMVAPVLARWSRRFLTDPGAIGDSPGVSEVIDGTGPTATARLRRLGESRLDQLRSDVSAREAVLDAYLSARGKSAAAFVDAVTALC
jgi:hypothetical protein